MGLRELQREAPEVVEAIQHDVLLALCEPHTFTEIVESVDVTILPERPVGARWNGNPYAPGVIVMDLLARVVDAGMVVERSTSRGSVYWIGERLRDGVGI